MTPAAPIANGKHDAVSEAVVDLAVLVFHQHPDFDKQLALFFGATQSILQVIPARRCKAQTKLLGDFA